MDTAINRLANKFSAIITTRSGTAHQNEEKIRYALQVILCELVKLAVLLMLFTALGRLRYFMYSILILLTIRSFSGGKHLSGILRCIATTVVYFYITCVFAVNYILLTRFQLEIVLVLCLLLVVKFAPHPNPKRPITKMKRRRNLKLMSVLITILLSLILLSWSDTRLIACGATSLLLQSMQLISFRKEVSI